MSGHLPRTKPGTREPPAGQSIRRSGKNRLVVLLVLLGREGTCCGATRDEDGRVGTGDSVNAAPWERSMAHTAPFTADRVNVAMVWTSERAAGVAAEPEDESEQSEPAGGPNRSESLSVENQHPSSVFNSCVTVTSPKDRSPCLSPPLLKHVHTHTNKQHIQICSWLSLWPAGEWATATRDLLRRSRGKNHIDIKRRELCTQDSYIRVLRTLLRCSLTMSYVYCVTLLRCCLKMSYRSLLSPFSSTYIQRSCALSRSNVS